MKRLLAILILCLLITPAFADNKHNIITSGAKAQMQVEPEIVTFSASIITENKDSARAVEENNKITEQVHSSLKKMLGKEDKIKTTGFRVSPVYKWNRTTRKNDLQGYKATNQIFVETKKVDKAGEFLQIAVESGANSINDLRFTVEDRDKYCNELLKQAAKKAKTKAQVIAEALGVKIIGINFVTSSCNDTKKPIVRYGAPMMAEAESIVPVEPGDVDLNASITIDFLIQN